MDNYRIKIASILGIIKKVKQKESEYDTIKWYKLRLYNPITWVFCIIVLLVVIVETMYKTLPEFLEIMEYHERK